MMDLKSLEKYVIREYDCRNLKNRVRYNELSKVIHFLTKKYGNSLECMSKGKDTLKHEYELALGKKFVIEYCERQHSESVPFFDRRLTVSGIGRGEQRKIYDERRKEILPKHGIRLISISYSDFEYDSRKRIVREYQRDIQIVKNMLGV